MAQVLLEAPAIVKVFGALALILVANFFCKRLLVSIAVGALALGLWCGHSVPGMGRIALDRLGSTGNLFLMIIVFQVIWLSSQMSATGLMGDLVAAVRARVSRRGAMAVLPAVIGLLPMPGGALFSAPLVDRCDAGGSVEPRLKAQANHWFRHVWECWWPLYPGVLMAIEATKLEVWHFALLGIPISLGAMAAGYVFLLRRIDRDDGEAAAETAAEGAHGFFSLVRPIVVVIVCYAAMRLGYGTLARAWPGIPEMNLYLPMAVGLLCAMAVLQFERPLGWRQWRAVLFSRHVLDMVLIVAAIRIYGAFIEADLPGGGSLVKQLHLEMEGWGVPLLPIIMILPLVSGMATGLALGFVGASFPIVVSLLGENPPIGTVLSTTVLAYGFGYVGMLLSPVHVCLIVTSKYFKTGLVRNALGMLKPAVAVLAWVVVLHLLVRAIVP